MRSLRGSRFWRRFRRQRAALGAAGFLVFLVAVAVFAPLLAPYDPLDQELRNILQPPTGEHLLGTDHLGRDQLSRLIFASRISLLAAVQATLAAVAIGVPLGLVAGYVGGWWDRAIMRTTDIVMALPGIVLVIAVIAVLGNNLTNAMVALGLVFTPPLLRLTRGATLAVREEQYVDAAQVIGLPGRRVIRRHVLPNVASPIVVQLVLTLGFAMLVEAGLAFLGLGVQPPAASWGKMLTEASAYIGHQAFGVFPPGIVITLTVLAVNFLGDGLRDSLGRGVGGHRRPRRGFTATREPEATRPATEPKSLLRISDLSIAFPDDRGEPVPVVQGVDIEIVTGEMVGLVGESGSGKTMTALSVLGLVPAPGVVSGDIGFDGRRLMTLTEAELTNVRGREIGMVFQEPVASLDPVFTIGHQIAEPLRRHLGMSRAEARVHAIELLNRVGVPHPQRRIDDYPHQFSGGMAQRVMIATALSCSPKLLIADEPTTALDVTTQAEILDLLRELQADFGMAVLLITHDLGVIADICDRAYVMYAGQVVEEGGLESVFGHPRHPYTEALLQAAPETSAGARRAAINVIPGSIPEPGEWPTGCRFHPRCRYAITECAAVEPEYRRVEGSMARCLLAERLTLAASDRSAG